MKTKKPESGLVSWLFIDSDVHIPMMSTSEVIKVCLPYVLHNQSNKDISIATLRVAFDREQVSRSNSQARAEVPSY